MKKNDKSTNLKDLQMLGLTAVLGVLLFLLLGSGIFKPIFGFLQNITIPVQATFYRSSQGLGNILETVVDVGSLRSRNSNLREENARLIAENTLLRKLKSENESLRKQLNTPETELRLKASASLIGFSGLGSESILLIDKGSSSGVSVGDFVVVENILIGKVVEANTNLSSIQLLTDPDTKIPVKTESGAEGILEGQFGSSLLLTNVSQDEILKEGQILLTSGKNEYPANLVVGKLSKVNKIEKEFFQKAEVEQLLKIRDLSLVFVVGTK